MTDMHLFSAVDSRSLPRTTPVASPLARSAQPTGLRVKSSLRFASTMDDEAESTMPTTPPPCAELDAADEETEVIHPWTREARTEAAAARNLKALRSQSLASPPAPVEAERRPWFAAAWAFLRGLFA